MKFCIHQIVTAIEDIPYPAYRFKISRPQKNYFPHAHKLNRLLTLLSHSVTLCDLKLVFLFLYKTGSYELISVPLKITTETGKRSGVNLFLFFNRHNINRLKMRVFYLLNVCKDESKLNANQLK